MPAGVTGNPAGNPADDEAVAALTELRDHGIVTDRAALNRAWAELVGRIPPTSGDRCQHPHCTEIGASFAEPAGTWCPDHRPTLWRISGRPWATPRCHWCGKPGAYPNRGNSITRPACRDHAPRWMKPYLMNRSNEEMTA